MTSNNTGSVTILIYHSINDLSNAYIRRPNMVSLQNFSAQMRFLSKSKRVIELDEYTQWIRADQPITEECVVITFDDGYRDNYTQALPVLREYQLPATFFLATNYIGSGWVKWEDQVNYLIRQSQVTSYKLSLGKNRSSAHLSTENQEEKLNTINRVVDHLKRVTNEEREALIKQVREQSGIAEEQVNGHGLMLSWDDVCEMAKTPGITFGSHTQSHLPLSSMTDEEITEEVVSSKQAIETVIRRPVRSFSFPYGEESDPRMISILKSSGIDCAVSGTYGVNYATSDPYRLKRVNAMNQSGRRFWAGLQLRRSPVGESLRKLYNRVTQISQL